MSTSTQNRFLVREDVCFVTLSTGKEGVKAGLVLQGTPSMEEFCHCAINALEEMLRNERERKIRMREKK